MSINVFVHNTILLQLRDKILSLSVLITNWLKSVKNISCTEVFSNLALRGPLSAGTPISTATQALTPITLSCPDDNGDYVLLYWQQTEKHSNMTHIFWYDRWRDSTSSTVQPGILELAGPPYNAEAGSFAFRLTPDVTNGGVYICDVYLNDKPKSLRTEVSVLKGRTNNESRCCWYKTNTHMYFILYIFAVFMNLRAGSD